MTCNKTLRVPTLCVLALMTTMMAWAGVPQQSRLLPGLDEDSMRVRLSQLDLQPIEGIWYYQKEKMTLGIERNPTGDEGDYRIVLLDSEDLDLMPGMVVGYLNRSVTATKWQLTLYSERDRLTLSHPMECVATYHSGEGTLTFRSPHWKVRVRMNLTRFLPTIFHAVSVMPEKQEESLPIGFKKIYPAEGDSGMFNEIRYL